MHTTIYFDSFIEVADDCPVAIAEAPPQKVEKTAVSIIFEMVRDHSYQYTSDELIFHVHALKKGISSNQTDKEKERFFARGQPCLRTSPLGKRYGWGIHFNSEGKVAIYAVESDEYKQFSTDKSIRHLKAMRSKI